MKYNYTRKHENNETSMQNWGARFLFFFICGCVPRGFQNVGSGERIFLEKLGSWEQKFGKIWVYRARILAKTWLKMQKFYKN